MVAKLFKRTLVRLNLLERRHFNQRLIRLWRKSGFEVSFETISECISRAQGEIRETKHHLKMAFNKKYLPEEKIKYFIREYEECSKMLYGLEHSLQNLKS